MRSCLHLCGPQTGPAHGLSVGVAQPPLPADYTTAPPIPTDEAAPPPLPQSDWSLTPLPLSEAAPPLPEEPPSQALPPQQVYASAAPSWSTGPNSAAASQAAAPPWFRPDSGSAPPMPEAPWGAQAAQIPSYGYHHHYGTGGFPPQQYTAQSAYSQPQQLAAGPVNPYAQMYGQQPAWQGAPTAAPSGAPGYGVSYSAGPYAQVGVKVFCWQHVLH